MDQQSARFRRKRKTRDQIAEILRKFTESGSTVKQFCEDHQIAPVTFHKWQSRMKGKSLNKEIKAGFTQLQVNPTFDSLFAEVKGIRIYQQVSASFLKELRA